MRPFYKSWFCMLDITNYCEKTCVYCSRWARHLRPDQYFFMTLDEIDFALETLMPIKKSATAWPSRIGLIGGEPTLHPDFEQICKLLLKRAPKEKYGLISYGGKVYKEYLGLIKKTFGLIEINEKNEDQKKVCRHQPATIAIGEAVPDDSLREKLVDNCWVQLNWCPTIAQDKAYFCEVAYAIDYLFELDCGWKVDYDWFVKMPAQFKDQVDMCCHLCGMPVPMERQLLNNNKEMITPKLLELMKSKNLKFTGDKVVEVFEETLNLDQVKENLKTWDPRNYRQDLYADNPTRPGRSDKNMRYDAL